MSAHLRYLSYVMRHKWHVARGGLIFGVGWWRIFKHDWTKFVPAEWGPYVDCFYREGGEKAAFKAAWLHHIHWNDHHWQHWYLLNDDGEIDILPMPEACVREMVADWYGAGYAINGRDDLDGWYAKNSQKMSLHPTTREVVVDLLKAHCVPVIP